MHRSTLRIYLMLILLVSISAPSPLKSRAANDSTLATFARTHTVTMTYVDEGTYPGRQTNAKVAFKALQTFFDKTPMQRGTPYSFINDVLHNTLTNEQGYIGTPNGFGYGTSGAASLLNNLIVNTAFWDTDGIEKPLLQKVRAAVLRGDRSYSVYGVNITVDSSGKNAQDFVWQLNPTYQGTPPTLTIVFDASAATVSMTANYFDQSAPPSRTLSFHDKALILANNLHAIIGERRLGVTVIPVSSPADEVDVNADLQNPIASAWKGGGTLYFFENIDPAIWTSIPVRYWNLRSVGRVPLEYQKLWLQNNQILRWVYVMAVFSGNHEAGNVLEYVYTHSKWHSSANAITAFNEWSQQEAGVSAASGLHRWQAGGTWAVGVIDHKRDNHTITVGDKQIPYDNTYSAHDLALYYLRLATVGKQRGYYDTVSELLSTRTDILSMLKSYSSDTGIQAASKIGYFAPDSPDSLGHDVNNDGGLLTLPDGEQYVVTAMAFDAVDIQGNVVSAVSRALINTYQIAPAK